MDRREWEELDEIREEMINLYERAKRIMIREGGITYQRAKVYWMPEIEMALQNDHSYLGKCMHSFEDSLKELEPDEADSDEDSDEDENSEESTLGGYERNAHTCVGGESE